MSRFAATALALAAGLGLGLALPAVLHAPRAPEGPAASAATPAAPRGGGGGPAVAFGGTTIADLVERVDGAVVNIDTIARGSALGETFLGEDPGAQQEERGVGSGFVLDPSGYVVTNNHVVAGATTIWVTTATGKRFAGKVIGSDPSTDLALVKVNATGLPALKFAKEETIRVGSWVVAIGSPLGLSHTVSVGIISAMNRDLAITERGSFLQTDAAINPGNSGGPLIDLAGQVVGVNTAIAARGQGIGFAIPAWTAQNVVAQLREKGRVDRPYIGISIRDIGPDAALGVAVIGVQAGSPGARAGLRPGDRILAIDGAAVQTSRQLLTALTDKAIGQRVSLAIARGNARQTLQVELEAMPPHRAIPQ